MAFGTIKMAGSSMKNVQTAIDVTAHNIANVNTTGYKEKNVNFESVVNSLSDSGRFSGTAVSSISSKFASGAVKATGTYTDLMIQGEGFFTLQNPSGETVFSRDGHFQIDASENLVDPNGNFVLSSGGGKISIPKGIVAVEINSAGEIKALYEGQTEFQLLDQLQLATFTNPQGLESLGNNKYKETVNSGIAEFSGAGAVGTSTASSSILSGALEGSNADLSGNMVNLIAYQRSYQAISKSATTANDVLETTLGLVR